MHLRRFLLVLTLIAALPTAASAVDFSVFGSFLDTDDLAESFGFGIRASFDIDEKLDFDITGQSGSGADRAAGG